MTFDARIDLLSDWTDPAEATEQYLDALWQARGGTAEDVALAAAKARPAVFDRLAATFGLDEAALQVLALVAAADDAQTDRLLTLAEAATLVPGAREALCPGAPLRHWRLVAIAGSGPLGRCELTLDERVAHHLRGTRYLDERLAGILHPVVPAEEVPPDPQMARAWRDTGPVPVLLLAGDDRIAVRAQAAALTVARGLILFRVAAPDLTRDWAQRAALAGLVDRELALSGAALLIEADGDSRDRAAEFADLLCGPLMIAAPEPAAPDRSPRVRIEMPGLDRQGRRAVWRAALAPMGHIDHAAVDRLSAQFALDAATITTAASAGPDADALWDAARAQGRRGLEALAQRIETRATWDDIVLPPETLAQLRDIARALSATWRVNEDWGWAARGERGLGLAALFAGASGTGKTFAAEIIAAELRLDLFRIDLSQVISKYIGETEKNLSRIFAEAEQAGAVLLFDEADALFGKRSDVKDSHDRHANVEVSYLLQRMEAYRGLAILTTNLKGALDHAFLRRLRFVVSFAFPDREARAPIWARVFPRETPTEGLDAEKLARLNLTGGAIRAVALNASYLAAAEGSAVTPAHVLRAAQREYDKLEKPFTSTEMEAFR